MLLAMDWSVKDVTQRQTVFSTSLVRQFMKKVRKYQNLLLKYHVNITDSGYESDLHNEDDDIELVLQENSTALDSCKSFWTFGAQVSVFRLVQWVYKVIQRTKATRILCHLDAVPENEIESTIREVAKELSVAFEYQLMMLYSDTEVIKLADHAVTCLMTYLNTSDSEFTNSALLTAILEVKPLSGNKKETIRTREIIFNGATYGLCWKLWQVFKQPGLRIAAEHLTQYTESSDDANKETEIPTDSETQHLLNNAPLAIEEEVSSCELEIHLENDQELKPATDIHDLSAEGVSDKKMKSNIAPNGNDAVNQIKHDSQKYLSDKQCQIHVSSYPTTSGTKSLADEADKCERQGDDDNFDNILIFDNAQPTLDDTYMADTEISSINSNNSVKKAFEDFTDNNYSLLTTEGTASFDHNVASENKLKTTMIKNIGDENIIKGLKEVTNHNVNIKCDPDGMEAKGEYFLNTQSESVDTVDGIKLEDALQEISPNRDETHQKVYRRNWIVFNHEIDHETEAGAGNNDKAELNTKVDSSENQTANDKELVEPVEEFSADENDITTINEEAVRRTPETMKTDSIMLGQLHTKFDQSVSGGEICSHYLSTESSPLHENSTFSEKTVTKSDKPDNCAHIFVTDTHINFSRDLGNINYFQCDYNKTDHINADANPVILCGNGGLVDEEVHVKSPSMNEILKFDGVITDRTDKLMYNNQHVAGIQPDIANTLHEKDNSDKSALLHEKAILDVNAMVETIVSKAITEHENASSLTSDENHLIHTNEITHNDNKSSVNEIAGFKQGNGLFSASADIPKDIPLNQGTAVKYESPVNVSHLEMEHGCAEAKSPYQFLGCFTPFGAKCRPHVYGFRGPLHVWNDREEKFTLVYNDLVTVVNTRTRHIPFTVNDMQQSYSPRTYCEHAH